jgi:hypothetical protein
MAPAYTVGTAVAVWSDPGVATDGSYTLRTSFVLQAMIERATAPSAALRRAVRPSKELNRIY